MADIQELRKRMNEEMAQGNYLDAREIAGDILEKEKNDFRAVEIFATVSVLPGYGDDFAGSKAMAAKLAKNNPGSAEAMAIAARIYDWCGEYEKEVETYNKVLGIDPANYEALTGLANSTTKPGIKLTAAQAETYLKKAIEVEPENYNAYMLLGLHYFHKKKDPKTAREYFDLSLEKARKSDDRERIIELINTNMGHSIYKHWSGPGAVNMNFWMVAAVSAAVIIVIIIFAVLRMSK